MWEFPAGVHVVVAGKTRYDGRFVPAVVDQLLLDVLMAPFTPAGAHRSHDVASLAFRIIGLEQRREVIQTAT